MDSSILFLSVIGFIAVLLIVLIFMLGKLIGRVRELEDNLPTSDVLNGVGRISNRLTEQLEQTGKIIKHTPDRLESRLGQEISQGLSPLVSSIHTLEGELQESQRRFQGIVATLAEPGSIDDIASQLQNAVTSLERLAATVGGNDQTLTTISSTTSEILRQWAEQRDVFEQSYVSVTGVLVKWTEQEQTHLQNVEHRMDERLKELLEQEELQVEGTNELRGITQSLAESTKQTQESIGEITQKVEEISGHQADAGLILKTNAEHIESLSRQVRETLNGYQRLVEAMQAHETAMRDFQTNAIKELREQLTGLLKINHQVNNKATEAIEEQNRLFVDRSDQARKAFDKMVETAQDLAPRQELHNGLLIALVVLQVLSPVVLIFAAYLMFAS